MSSAPLTREALISALNKLTEDEDHPTLWWDVDMQVWYATPRIEQLADAILAALPSEEEAA
jgi:hypothetical protein